MKMKDIWLNQWLMEENVHESVTGSSLMINYMLPNFKEFQILSKNLSNKLLTVGEFSDKLLPATKIVGVYLCVWGTLPPKRQEINYCKI